MNNLGSSRGAQRMLSPLQSKDFPQQQPPELLSSEYDTYETVRARFWRWLAGKGPVPCKGVPSLLSSGPSRIEIPFTVTLSSSSQLSSLELSDRTVHAPSIRALLGTASHICEVVVLKHHPVCQMAGLRVTGTIVSEVLRS